MKLPVLPLPVLSLIGLAALAGCEPYPGAPGYGPGYGAGYGASYGGPVYTAPAYAPQPYYGTGYVPGAVIVEGGREGYRGDGDRYRRDYERERMRPDFGRAERDRAGVQGDRARADGDRARFQQQRAAQPRPEERREQRPVRVDPARPYIRVE